MRAGTYYAIAVLLVLAGLAGCSDSEQPGADGRPQAAGAEDVRQAVRAYSASAPVRRVGQYSQAVAQGLLDPMAESAKRQQAQSQALLHHMSGPRPLAADERCLGSSIVRVDTAGKVPTYTQVLEAGKPVYCTDSIY